MAERLALAVVPGTGWRASDIRSVAREAEAAGFEAIFAAEVNVDVLAVAQLMGEATNTIKVGSWIANIYLRHSYLCAKHAALIADATEGRMILGPISRCRERLAAFTEAGLDLPILVPPIGVEGTRAVIRAFKP